MKNTSDKYSALSPPANVTPLLLLVEDNEDDVFLFKRVLRKAGIGARFDHVDDGRRAVERIEGSGEFQDREDHPKPSLVLLDLKLPHRDGHEILQWARSSKEYDNVCIVVLSSSGERSDVERAYAAGANGYLTKPISSETFSELWTEFLTLWPDSSAWAVLRLSKSLKR